MNENKDYISKMQEQGALHISEEVIVSVAGIAIMETEGVAGIGAGVGADLAKTLGMKSLNKGIRISISEEKEITLDCTIVAKLGQSVLEVAKNVQDGVITNVESVTGLKVSAVNVTVGGIALPKDGKR